VEIYFSNPDQLFSNEFPTNRFGQGSLAIALKALLTEVSPKHPPPFFPHGHPLTFKTWNTARGCTSMDYTVSAGITGRTLQLWPLKPPSMFATPNAFLSMRQ